MPEANAPSRRRRRVKSARHQQRARAKGVLFVGLCVIGAIALLVLALIFGPRLARSWQEARAVKRARTSLAAAKFDDAVANAQHALQFDPDSVPALQILADATEKQNKPDTIAWRAQLARVQKSSESQLNLASAALRFGQLDVARRALDAVPQHDRASAAYHVVAGWLARAQGDDAGVERHFAAAVKKEPGNALYQFNLAALQIKSTDGAKSASARATLEKLAQSSDHRAGALRALLNDAIHRKDATLADRYAQDLQMSQQVTFSDYLLCLDFYKKLDQEKLSALLEKVKPVAARNPADLALLLAWMNANGMSADVLRWTEKLPSDLTTNPPPSIEVAEALTTQKNWSRLRRWTRSGSWNDYEYLRFAYQAYGARQTRQSAADAEFESLWTAAVRACEEKPSREIRLARLATKWNFNVEAEQLWLRVAHDPLTRREALDALFTIYRNDNDLPNLYLTAMRLHETSPNEAQLAAEFSRLSLVLERNTNEGVRVAREAYDAAPAEPAGVVAQALALYSQGRTGEGIALLRKLSDDVEHSAHVAVYVAVLLLDDNQNGAAQEFITAARKEKMFVEERKLLDDAIRKNQMSQPSPSSSPSASPAASP